MAKARRTVRQQLEGPIREAGLRETARRSGVHPATICRWLQGNRRLHVEHVESIARALGLRLQVL